MEAKNLTNEGGFDLQCAAKDTSGSTNSRECLIRDIATRDTYLSKKDLFSPREDGEESYDSDQTMTNRAFPAPDEGAMLPTFRPSLRPREITFYPLQEWEGYVVAVGEDVFTARILDLTAGSQYEEEEADFPIEDLSESDLNLLRPGAVFRWAIGYQRSRGGTKRRVSQIVFRQLPQWTAYELEENRRKAKELGALLRGE